MNTWHHRNNAIILEENQHVGEKIAVSVILLGMVLKLGVSLPCLAEIS